MQCGKKVDVERGFSSRNGDFDRKKSLSEVVKAVDSAVSQVIVRRIHPS